MLVSVVCATAPLDSLGGLQRRIQTLVRGLASSGTDVSIVQSTWAASRSERFLAEVASSGVESLVVDAGASPSRPDTLARLYLSRKLARLVADSDIVDLYDPVIGIGRFADARWIYTAIGLIPYYVTQLLTCGFRQSALGLYRSLFEPIAMRRASGLIVENGSMARFAGRFHGLSPQAVAVIPGGYDASVVDAIRPQPPVGSDVVYCGRLTWMKGLRELLSAFASLSTTHPTWRLWMVGDGPDSDRLKSLARELKIAHRVQFTGRLEPDVASTIVAQSAIFVLPSYIESLPLSLIEAMALGRPVIATDVGGIREHLVRSGTEGLLVPAKSPWLLAKALAELMRSPELRVRMGAAARLRVAELTIGTLVDSTRAFYRRIAQGRSSSG